MRGSEIHPHRCQSLGPASAGAASSFFSSCRAQAEPLGREGGDPGGEEGGRGYSEEIPLPEQANISDFVTVKDAKHTCSNLDPNYCDALDPDVLWDCFSTSSTIPEISHRNVSKIKGELQERPLPHLTEPLHLTGEEAHTGRRFLGSHRRTVAGLCLFPQGFLPGPAHLRLRAPWAERPPPQDKRPSLAAPLGKRRSPTLVSSWPGPTRERAVGT